MDNQQTSLYHFGLYETLEGSPIVEGDDYLQLLREYRGTKYVKDNHTNTFFEFKDGQLQPVETEGS